MRKLQPRRSFFTDSDSTRLFDLDCGTDRVRKAFQAGASAVDLNALFQEGAAAFAQARKPYLLY